MKEARLNWCKAHVDLPDEFWHNIIWTDETSVILGHRRGGYRIWRRPWERVTKSAIRPRWKGYLEFMFWGSFSYFYKGPCYIYKLENAQMREKAVAKIEELNKELEPVLREEWELDGIRRLGLRGIPGKKLEWKWDIAYGKLSRSKNGGIDWYRYWSEILCLKLLPFARKVGPDAKVIEDGVEPHKHWFTQKTYLL
jgi:hypothetical protein